MPVLVGGGHLYLWDLCEVFAVQMQCTNLFRQSGPYTRMEPKMPSYPLRDRNVVYWGSRPAISATLSEPAISILR